MWGGGGEWGGEEGGGWGDEGGLGIVGGVTSSPHHIVNTCAAECTNTPNKDSLGGGQMGGVCIGLDSDRAGSRTLEKSSR
jgi:hypothetical protein